MVELNDFLERRPAALSGGQRQRVALARAIVREPNAFLMDEPLSNLDAKLRVSTRAQIKNLHHTLKTTTIYVTHDQIEAMTLADRVVVMNKGVVQQIGTPTRNLRQSGQHLRRRFPSSSPAMNLVPGMVQNGASSPATISASRALNSGADGPVTLGFRAEDAAITGSGGQINAPIYSLEPAGRCLVGVDARRRRAGLDQDQQGLHRRDRRDDIGDCTGEGLSFLRPPDRQRVSGGWPA